MPQAKRPTKSVLVCGRVLPILRWVGGKQRLVNSLVSRLPPDLKSRVYVEPFLGAGSLFLAVRPDRAVISDLNAELIRCYSQVRRSPEAVARCLSAHRRRHSATHFYRVRDTYNKSKWGPSQAARFIYLNRTCFNGIFRVNKRGEFNVPYGYKRHPVMPDLQHLRVAAMALGRASLRTMGFQEAVNQIQEKSFVYFDPPYPPLNGTAYFTHYTPDRFNPDDQQELADCVATLDARGIPFLMSNAATPLVRSLYRRYRVETVPVTRFVTCWSNKHQVRELLIRNY